MHIQTKERRPIPRPPNPQSYAFLVGTYEVESIKITFEAKGPRRKRQALRDDISEICSSGRKPIDAVVSERIRFSTVPRSVVCDQDYERSRTERPVERITRPATLAGAEAGVASIAKFEEDIPLGAANPASRTRIRACSVGEFGTVHT